MSRTGPPSLVRPKIALPLGAQALARASVRSSSEPPAARSFESDSHRGGSVAQLRLAIGKEGLGLELAAPVRLACLDIVDLVVRLPQVRFPFEVSGGVARFRHKRGELDRMTVELDARRTARWAESRLRGLLSPDPCAVSLTARAFGATVTVHAQSRVPKATLHAHDEHDARVAALAFEVTLVPSHDALALVVGSARGAHLPEPATTLALRALTALLAGSARREGSRFIVADAAGLIARWLLPDAGVRVPSSDEVRVSASGESDGVLVVAFTRGGALATLPDDATLALEAAILTRDGDDARMARDTERARQYDLSALQRAPRHPEIARRIAEIDHIVGGRAESASATLRESGGSAHLGLLFGELRYEAGDAAGAIASFVRAGEREPSPVVAALAFARAAEIATDPHDALAWLDAALGRAPLLAELRWERAKRRLRAGRLADARADFQELEALAHGPRERHDVLRRAGDAYRSSGLGADAATLYERALLYQPDDPEALAGLGASLAAGGRAARGAAILAHAIEAGEACGVATSWMQLELGRVLGELLGDRPAAVARLRSVTDDAPQAVAARGLEGRLRAQLGDVSGASLAFARMRERAGREPSARPWLEEAAKFERDRFEMQAAQAHLAAAISIAPEDETLTATYREVSALIAHNALRPPVEPLPAWPRQEEVAEPAATDLDTGELPTSDLAASAAAPFAFESERDVGSDDAEAAMRVEALTRTLQGDPSNDAVVDELVVLLTRLGRSMDLLALLSARLEDAPEGRRELLLPRHRTVLETLEREARSAGRDAEADLFKMARDAS